MNKGGLMEHWESEPLWETLDRLRAVHQVCAADTVVVTLRERSQLPCLAATNYKGLDVIKSKLGVGLVGVVIRS
jgi:hypothetical protein